MDSLKRTLVQAEIELKELTKLVDSFDIFNLINKHALYSFDAWNKYGGLEAGMCVTGSNLNDSNRMLIYAALNHYKCIQINIGHLDDYNKSILSDVDSVDVSLNEKKETIITLHENNISNVRLYNFTGNIISYGFAGTKEYMIKYLVWC